MSNATDPVFPVADWGACQLPGLTKRELFAALVMQGILANGEILVRYGMPTAETAKNAVDFADALLAELAKEPQS